MYNVAAFKNLENRIHSIRGYNVILDYDLAELFQTETKTLNRAVQRNLKRFPPHFMFQINALEFDLVQAKIQIEDSSRGKHRKFMPFAFTEHGVAMLSGVLNTPVAFEINISIIETFVQLRKLRNALPLLQSQVSELMGKVDDLAHRLGAGLTTTQDLVSQTTSESGRRPNYPSSKFSAAAKVREIQVATAKYYGLGIKQLLSAVRTKSIAFPRQVAIYLVRKSTAMSYVEIAQNFGGKDHTTILFACRKIERMLLTDPDLQVATKEIIGSLDSINLT